MIQTRTREEHLAWCKQRALAYCDEGNIQEAFASMGSDMQKHPETANHPAVTIGMAMLCGGFLSTPDKMRRFIEGFH